MHEFGGAIRYKCLPYFVGHSKMQYGCLNVSGQWKPSILSDTCDEIHCLKTKIRSEVLIVSDQSTHQSNIVPIAR